METAAQIARRSLLRYPHAKLTTPSQAVPSELFGSEQLRNAIARLSDTAQAMYLLSVSAPKLRIPWRVLLISNPQRTAYDAFINPKLVESDAVHHGMWENCVSLEVMYVWMRRPRQITLEAADANGERRVSKHAGLAARMILHELEHLDGKCILTQAPSRDFIVTSDALMQRHTWRSDFPSREAYRTPLFQYFDEATGLVAPVPALTQEAHEANRQMPCTEKLGV